LQNASFKWRNLKLSRPEVLCGSPLLKKTTTHLGQFRESTGQ